MAPELVERIMAGDNVAMAQASTIFGSSDPAARTNMVDHLAQAAPRSSLADEALDPALGPAVAIQGPG